jgi:multimeric flavodoxin WrbA
MIRLHGLVYQPCKACGEAPATGYCIYDDALTTIYDKIVECDVVLFGSPIYFDSVSAQAKAFIDRCNCMRPADFNNTDPGHDFLKLIKRKRLGAIVLVGGKQGWFEGARRTIAGFFKWVEIVNHGMVTFQTTDYNRTGEVVNAETTLEEARQLGERLADAVRSTDD